MGVLASLFKSESVNLAPDSDFWYQPVGIDSAAGMRVTAETAMRLSAVYACVRVLAETMASMPLEVFKLLADGSKLIAHDHPVYKVLQAPNKWQTSFEWREMMHSHLELRGNAYSFILDGPKGPIDQLVPIHPDRVQVKRYTDGSLTYHIRMLNGTMETFMPEEIFHLRGLSLDGYTGLSPISIQREVIGKGLAEQDYGARFLNNNAKPGLVLVHPGKLGQQAADRLKQSVQESYTGANRHKTMVLEEGMKVQVVGITNKDAQFLESMKYTDAQIAGIFRVPPHMVGILDKATHSNVEHMGIEFTTYTVVPRARRWQGVIVRDLMFDLPGETEDDEYLVEFIIDGLNRGDKKSRYESYAVGRNAGFLDTNMILREEGKNPVKHGDGDFWVPVNMRVANDPSTWPDAGIDSVDAAGSGAGDSGSDGTGDTGSQGVIVPPAKIAKPSSRLIQQFKHMAASALMKAESLSRSISKRMARKEGAALAKMLASHRGNAEMFCLKATEFYAGHKDVLRDSLQIPADVANQYCDGQYAMLCRDAVEGDWDIVEARIRSIQNDHEVLAAMAMEMQPA